MRLEKRVAIVTGGANGIGEAYSKGLAEEGASVVVADIDEKRGKEIASDIEKTGGNQSEAARILGVSRVTIWKRIKKYGINLLTEIG